MRGVDPGDEIEPVAGARTMNNGAECHVEIDGVGGLTDDIMRVGGERTPEVDIASDPSPHKDTIPPMEDVRASARMAVERTERGRSVKCERNH